MRRVRFTLTVDAEVPDELVEAHGELLAAKPDSFHLARRGPLGGEPEPLRLEGQWPRWLSVAHGPAIVLPAGRRCADWAGDPSWPRRAATARPEGRR